MTFRQRLTGLLEYYSATCPVCRLYGEHDYECGLKQRFDALVDYVEKLETPPKKKYVIWWPETKQYLTNEGMRYDAKGLAQRFDSMDEAAQAIAIYKMRNFSGNALDVEEVEA